MTQNSELQIEELKSYYRRQSFLYDWTRWSFLFGREELINQIPDLPPEPQILEVGCGTGQNLLTMEYLFPDAQIYGIDLSGDMIRRAQQKVDDRQKIELINGVYGNPKSNFEFGPFDLILLSYSLSMLGSRAQQIIKQVHADLAHNGYIAVVDFNESPFTWFQRWMKVNHVDMVGELQPPFDKYFTPLNKQQKKAYGGLWNYLLFIGERRRLVSR